jgi:lipoate-protein ligase A
MFDSCIEDMAEVLNADADKFVSKGVNSVRSRVTNIREHLATEVTLPQFQEGVVADVSINGHAGRRTPAH